MTPSRRVTSTGRRGGAVLLAMVASASLATVPAGALTALPLEDGTADSDVLALDATVDPSVATADETDLVADDDPLSGLVESVVTVVEGLPLPVGEDPPPADADPTPTDPHGDADTPGTSPSSGSDAGPASGSPAEGSGRTVVPASDGAAATSSETTRTEPPSAPAAVAVRAASPAAPSTSGPAVETPAVGGFPRSVVFHLPDSDRFAGRASPSGGTQAGVRSTAAVVDLLSGLSLTPAQLARVFAPFPVAGRATYTDEGGTRGTDLFAAAGTPVISATAGTINRIRPDALRLTGPDGTEYLYAGLERLHPAAVDGGRVAKGQVLGFVGRARDGARLHFEIRTRSGAAVAPAPFLDRWLAEALATVRTLERAPDGTLSIQVAGGRRSIVAPSASPSPSPSPVRRGVASSTAAGVVHRMAYVASTADEAAPWGGVLVAGGLLAWFGWRLPASRRRRHPTAPAASEPVGGLLDLG